MLLYYYYCFDYDDGRYSSISDKEDEKPIPINTNDSIRHINVSLE